MSTSAWRGLLLVLCVVFLAQEAATIPLTRDFVGITGVTVTGRQSAFEWHVTVSAGSPAYAAGLRTGDVLDAKDISPAERFRLWSGNWQFGQPVRFSVIRRGGVQRLTVMPAHQWFEWELWLAVAAGFWTGLCAIVLVWRKAESWDVRIIVLWLLTVRLSIQMGPPNWVTPWAAADAVNNIVANLMFAGWALLATYATSFPAGTHPVARVLKMLTYALGTFTVLVTSLAVVAAWYGFIDPEGSIFTGGLSQGLQLAYFVAPALCAIVVLAESRGQDRERLAWIAGPAVAYTVIAVVYFLPTVSSVFPAVQSDAVAAFFLALQLLAPIGLTYAMLNRRLLDIGFVLNRAAVFAGVSVVVVGVFVLLEWAFSEWFSSATHTENILASAGLALVLGFSIRAIHSRVDRTLDTFFFRKRHDNEAAIRQFAREAPYITDAGTLVERTIAVLRERADAAFVSIQLDGNDGRYGDVDENDPAIVSLRASHRVLDLSTVATALRGEFAYPMVARGRLVGVLVLGPKTSGESYAPDESAAIETLAHAVGGSLDVLNLNDGSLRNGVVSDIRQLRGALVSATEQFNEAASRLAALVERLPMQR